MTEEYFDVVDENDRPVRRATRRDVHANGWWHRAVHILVFNAAGELFLQKRSLGKDVSPGLWTVSCSGHVDAGEGYDAAAQRELGEELGLQIAVVPPKWLRLEPCVATGWEFSWVYRLNAEGPFALNPVEIELGEWRSPHLLTQQLAAQPGEYCPGFRWIWALVAPRLQQG